MRINDIRNGHLYIGGVDTNQLASEYGTPLYVFNKEKIHEKLAEINNIFLNRYPKTKAFYASKAFLTLEMARIINQSKLGIDVASIGECYIALKAGIHPERILFHGNNKTDETLKFAIKHKIGRIVVDNLEELNHLANLTKNSNQSVKILLRFLPRLPQIHTHKNIQTGHEISKFGIDLNTHIEAIINLVEDHPKLELLGLHFHVGSQLETNQNHLEAIEAAFEIMKKMKNEHRINIQELNIGGGFGIYYNKDNVTLALEDFIVPCMNLIEQLSMEIGIERPVICIEPGRYVVGESAITLYRVGALKQINDQHSFLAIDGGMTDNLRVALYQGKYECMIANKANSKPTHQYTVVGNACESTDIMIESIDLPEAEKGDIIAFFSTGAYEHSLANNFNKMLRPAVVMVSDGKDHLIQRRDTLEDLISRDQ